MGDSNAEPETLRSNRHYSDSHSPSEDRSSDSSSPTSEGDIQSSRSSIGSDSDSEINQSDSQSYSSKHSNSGDEDDNSTTRSDNVQDEKHIKKPRKSRSPSYNEGPNKKSSSKHNQHPVGDPRKRSAQVMSSESEKKGDTKIKRDHRSRLDDASKLSSINNDYRNVAPQRDVSQITEAPKPKTFGTYIPPAKLRRLQDQITDKNSEEYQKLSWEALRKSINGHINKVNVSNIKNIVVELLRENVIRGKGLYCRCIMKAQAASPSFTAVYSALTAIINTKFPQVGLLLVKRLLSQFRRGYKRGDKQVCLNTAKFLAHCVNQRFVHEILALQLLMLLLKVPTDSSIEVAVAFVRDCGAFLSDNSPKAVNTIFDRLRDVLHEGNIEKRTQYMIEILFQVRRDKFKDNPAIPPGLDVIEEDDLLIHMLTLDDENFDTEDVCNVFRYDPNFSENEEKYKKISNEILGEDDNGDDTDSDDNEEADDESSDEDGIDDEKDKEDANRIIQIQDETDVNNMNFRRAIYLTIMSSFSFEECAHKLMKLDMKPGQEQAFASMMIECCSVERTYITMYGLVAERFCRLNRIWATVFAQEFERAYKVIHRYEINLLRNMAKFFAHLISTDAITWEVFVLVRLTEADTTSSLRIFLKIIFQDLSEALGIKQLQARMKDPNLVVRVSTDSGILVRHVFEGTFPKDSPRNTRFAINYFTSIGLGALTEDLREHLKNAPKLIMAQKQEAESDEESDSEKSQSSSYCSTCSSSYCSTCSSSCCSTCDSRSVSRSSSYSSDKSNSVSVRTSSSISSSYSSSLISSLSSLSSYSKPRRQTSVSPRKKPPPKRIRSPRKLVKSPKRRSRSPYVETRMHRRNYSPKQTNPTSRTRRSSNSVSPKKVGRYKPNSNRYSYDKPHRSTSREKVEESVRSSHLKSSTRDLARSR